MSFGLILPNKELNIFELDSMLFNIFFASSEIWIPDNICLTLLKSIDTSFSGTSLTVLS